MGLLITKAVIKRLFDVIIQGNNISTTSIKVVSVWHISGGLSNEKKITHIIFILSNLGLQQQWIDITGYIWMFQVQVI